MLFLLDTNAVSDYMQESVKIEARLAALAPTDTAVTCVIVRGEILTGIARLPLGKRRTHLARRAVHAFSGLGCLPVDEGVAEHYARVKAEALGRGFPLGENDLWIAAVAIHAGAILVTRDKDFTRVAGLDVVDWTT
jgi:predicted nucleic acid-binding protein